MEEVNFFIINKFKILFIFNSYLLNISIIVLVIYCFEIIY